jgi:hypothetical protein
MGYTERGAEQRRQSRNISPGQVDVRECKKKNDFHSDQALQYLLVYLQHHKLCSSGSKFCRPRKQPSSTQAMSPAELLLAHIAMLSIFYRTATCSTNPCGRSDLILSLLHWCVASLRRLNLRDPV